jgi:hypothetical protein
MLVAPCISSVSRIPNGNFHVVLLLGTVLDLEPCAKQATCLIPNEISRVAATQLASVVHLGL